MRTWMAGIFARNTHSRSIRRCQTRHQRPGHGRPNRPAYETPSRWLLLEKLTRIVNERGHARHREIVRNLRLHDPDDPNAGSHSMLVFSPVGSVTTFPIRWPRPAPKSRRLTAPCPLPGTPMAPRIARAGLPRSRERSGVTRSRLRDKWDWPVIGVRPGVGDLGSGCGGPISRNHHPSFSPSPSKKPGYVSRLNLSLPFLSVSRLKLVAGPFLG
ncbi:hypothetical protein B0T19DRAFT_206348 [Cercophora scortea]|uniref:Uncharacterized protein n=1 Tax=Cercophora scortea TaxID=314031 RepID=A0AAE0IE81_9PEZI|nr:hypothetical protein B0T19DRAFT_206348 [Cercophora scortea]